MCIFCARYLKSDQMQFTLQFITTPIKSQFLAHCEIIFCIALKIICVVPFAILSPHFNMCAAQKGDAQNDASLSARAVWGHAAMAERAR
jgi:hypothetical protein